MQTEKENRLDNIRSAAKNVMSSLRETIWAVRQEEVNIEEFADRFTLFARNLVKDSAIDLQLTVSIAKPGILSPIQALNLYRICQESFSNAVKHANASKIECIIKADEKYLFYMSVKDNGKGFEANSASPKGHYGLENMDFRARELGAEFKITSVKNEGTLVELFLKR
jgi:signal transduction histidine kinase